VKRRRKRPHGVVDTSVLVAGIAGFRAGKTRDLTPSAQFLLSWVRRNTSTWLVSEEILDEYKRVLGYLRVRRNLIGSSICFVRKLSSLMYRHAAACRRIGAMTQSVIVPKQVAPTSS